MGKPSGDNIVTVTAQSIDKDDETMAATHGATISWRISNRSGTAVRVNVVWEAEDPTQGGNQSPVIQNNNPQPVPLTRVINPNAAGGVYTYTLTAVDTGGNEVSSDPWLVMY